MSIQSEINRISGNISNSLDAVAAKGVTVPVGSTSDDLAGLIELITGSSGENGDVYQDENGYLVLSDEPGTNVTVTSLSVTSNGTYTAPTGIAYTPVSVAVQPVLQSKTVSPSESQQTVTPDSGKDGLSSVTVNAVSSSYVGSGVTRRSSTDLSTSGATVTAPAGYYANSSSASVTSGSVTARTDIIGTDATISTYQSGLILSKNSVNNTPTVSAGYISSATYQTANVQLRADCNIQSAQTITPSTINQTIASGTYLTGTQTIAGDADLVSGNIKSGVSIFGVEGSYSGGGSKYTATISSTGNSSYCYVRHNNTTTYYTSGDTFLFEEGDSLYCYVKYSGGMGNTITLNGSTVAGGVGSTSASYTYTMLAKDIRIVLNYSGTASIGITESVIPITYIAAQTVTPNAAGRTVLATNRYFTGDITISGDADLVAGNIKNGVEIFGVTGTYSGGGSGTVSKKQVNFIDYDGTLLYSYTKAEANALQALPSNPSHTGLTAQGWNWSLTDIKAQLTAQPNADVWVGQMYITPSGNTEIDVSMPYGRLDPILTICVNGTITVDWGDDTTPNTVTGTSLTSRLAVSHSYALAGDYTISIHVVSGNYAFYGSSTYLILRKDTVLNNSRVYSNCIQAIRLGSGITSIGNSAFYQCCSLVSITIPDTVTSIGDAAFSYCYSLKNITIPDTVTSIGSTAFNYCCSLENITIPGKVTSIGNSAFQSCNSLERVTIPDTVTSMGSYVFYQCSALNSITIPDSVTSIGSYAFYQCFSLVSIVIPDTVTSIGTYAFYNCNSLASITIPDTVTDIASNVFANCYGMAEYHILRTTPPSLGTTAFNNIQSDCKIYVPSASLSDYQTATNWLVYADYMVGE